MPSGQRMRPTHQTLRRRTHKDLEFHVESPPMAAPQIFRGFDQAAAHAISLAAAYGSATIDVMTWSVHAARAWAGAYGIESYQADPEASVFERIEVRAKSQGMIP